ncbi:MAG: hypothetical protein ACO1QS_11175 [Verrucomicrobiota bacterium]
MSAKLIKDAMNLSDKSLSSGAVARAHLFSWPVTGSWWEAGYYRVAKKRFIIRQQLRVRSQCGAFNTDRSRMFSLSIAIISLMFFPVLTVHTETLADHLGKPLEVERFVVKKFNDVDRDGTPVYITFSGAYGKNGYILRQIPDDGNADSKIDKSTLFACGRSGDTVWYSNKGTVARVKVTEADPYSKVKANSFGNGLVQTFFGRLLSFGVANDLRDSVKSEGLGFQVQGFDKKTVTGNFLVENNRIAGAKYRIEGLSGYCGAGYTYSQTNNLPPWLPAALELRYYDEHGKFVRLYDEMRVLDFQLSESELPEDYFLPDRVLNPTAKLQSITFSNGAYYGKSGKRIRSAIEGRPEQSASKISLTQAFILVFIASSIVFVCLTIKSKK